MGCWNGTCAITNVHVYAGQEVIGMALVSSETERSRCYSNSYASPVPVFWYGKYNDYGAMGENTGEGFTLLLEAIKKKLVEMPQGENQYHDIPVTKEGFDEDMFFEADHEERLKVKTYYGESNVDHIIILKSVWDKIIDEYCYEDYIGEQGYRTVYFKNVIESLDEFLYEWLTPFLTRGTSRDDLDKLYLTMDLSDSAKSIYRKRWEDKNFTPNLFSECVYYALESTQGGMDYNLVHQSDIILDGAVKYINTYPNENSLQEFKNALIDLAKVQWVNMFMSVSRKAWIPPVGAGSQSDDKLCYKILADATLEAVNSNYFEEDI